VSIYVHNSNAATSKTLKVDLMTARPDWAAVETLIKLVMLTDALQQNTSLASFKMSDIDLPGLVTFAERLVDMDCLCELEIGRADRIQEYSMAFFAALLRSLERNTSLKFLVLYRMDDYAKVAKPFLPRIEYLLFLNRVGRHSLLRSDVPQGLWPRVFTSKPVSAKQDLIHFFLTEKPDIIAVLMA
jgi:hypothetical protein